MSFELHQLHDHDGCCGHESAERISLSRLEAARKLGWQCLKGLVANHADHTHVPEEGYRGITSRKWAILAAGSTALIGIGQTIGGALSGISAAILGGSHDAIDAVPLFLQSKNTQTENAHDAEAHDRAKTARAISFGAAALSLTYAGFRLKGYNMLSDNQNETILNTELGLALGALAVNSAIAYKPIKNSYHKLREGLRLTHNDHELKDHVVQDVFTSVSAVSAAVLSLKGQYTASESLGAASSVLVATRFMPYSFAAKIRALIKS